MKKFSKVKYFGAVAAALLAVAPIAAPVVSQVASPVTVQAAAAQPSNTSNQKWATALDNVFKDAVSNSTAAASTTDTSYYGGVNTYVAPSTIGDPTLISSFFKSGIDGKQLAGAGNTVSFQSKDFSATEASTIKSNFVGSSKTTYNFTITLRDASNNTLATKDVTLTIARNSKAVVAPATFKVGDSTKSLTAPVNVAGSLTLTDKDGKTVGVTDADIQNIQYQSNAGYGSDAQNVQSNLANATYQNTALKVANSDASAFANNGVFYQSFEIPATAFAAQGKYSNVNAADVAATSNGAAYVDPSGNLYFLRQVTVTTGTNDQAYFPVIKYTTGSDTSGSNVTTTSYFNGDTITDATVTAYAGSTAADGSDYTSLATALFGKFGAAAANVANTTDPVSGTFKGFENSIKGGGLQNGLGYNANSYTIAGVKLTGTKATDIAAIAAALPNYIKSNYAAGTTNIPVSVTNQRGLTSTVNIPVTITTNVGTPVATEFTGYTTIAKGASFDPLADVQFKNSSLDNGVIPSSRIKVSSNVDTSTPGTYTVTYTVTNAAGNTATFTRTVVVTAGDLTESNASGVVYINNASGAKVYSDAATSKETGNTLDNTTAWKYSSVVKDNAGKIVAYNLGGKQYVKAADVATSPVKAQAGVFTVHYPANAKWSIAVYNSDLKVLKLIPANSTWVTFGTKTFKDGKSYYNLGGNQWVRTDYGFWNAK